MIRVPTNIYLGESGLLYFQLSVEPTVACTARSAAYGWVRVRVRVRVVGLRFRVRVRVRFRVRVRHRPCW